MVCFAYVHAAIECARTSRLNIVVLALLVCLVSPPVLSQQGSEAPNETSVETPVNTGSAIGSLSEDVAVAERVEAERRDAFNPYVITAHKHNFILPISYTSNVNRPAFELEGAPEELNYKPYEVNFQISLKSQVNQNALVFAGDAFFFGITIESWWQLYNSPLSSPFRETNYQPELFYTTPLLWGPFGGKTALSVGLEHQSNGQLQDLSRSWNRVYTELIYGKGSFVATLRPWYRLSEDPKENPTDAEGDDNPDIDDYFGNAQLTLGWSSNLLEFSTLIRGNVSTQKGAIDSTLTFPLSGKFRGMVHYFYGYGDSLIDYDRFQHRVGFGIALTNLF